MIITVKLPDSRALMFLTKIIEGIGHLAVVKTLDGSQGIAEIYCTDNLAEDIRRLLQSMEIPTIKHFGKHKL